MSELLGVALEGNLSEFMRAEARRIAQANTDGIKEATDGLKADLRAQVAGALGARMGNAIRSKFYPNNGADPAGLVYAQPKAAPKVISAFDRGAVIKSANGFWLAIPTQNAPKRGEGGKRISPSTWPVARFGPLRFVYRKSGPSLLVVDDLRASYSKGGELRGFRKAKTAKAARATVVMFILVRQVSLRKRLDIQSVRRKWTGDLAERLARKYAESVNAG